MIYSPSKTEAYDFCSMKGKLQYRDHWEPKEAGNGTVGKIVGAAFARGSQDIHTGTSPGVIPAVTLFDRTVAHYIKHGVSFSMDLSTVKDQLVKALTKYEKEHPFKEWQIVATELELVDYGRCRLDILGVDPNHLWSIVDIKYKRSLNIDYLNKTVNEFRDSWQFQHYPWAYNDWVKQGYSTWLTGSSTGRLYELQLAQQMCLCLVIANPFKIYYYPFQVNLQYQKIWIDSARQKWADITAIESGERKPTVAAIHRSAYGDCEMKKFCLEYGMSEDLAIFEYTKVPRLPDEDDK